MLCPIRWRHRRRYRWHANAARSPDQRPAKVTEARVIGLGPFPYQVDGDHLGDTELLEFRHEADALTVVVP